MGGGATCDRCGGTDEGLDALTALSWTTSVERGSLRHYCDRCSREHLRAIEGKLDTEHW